MHILGLLDFLTAEVAKESQRMRVVGEGACRYTARSASRF